MLQHDTKKIQKNHTIVLQRRVSGVSNYQKNGLKEGHISYSRGSPPLRTTQGVRVSTHSPPRKVDKQLHTHFYTPTRRNDLVARFGVDTFLGSMVIHILLLLMVFQPIYVAFGMEIEEVQNSEEATVEEVQNTDLGEENVEEVSTEEVILQSGDTAQGESEDSAQIENTEINEGEEESNSTEQETLESSGEGIENDSTNEGESEEEVPVLENDENGTLPEDEGSEESAEENENALGEVEGNQEIASTTASTTEEVGGLEEERPVEEKSDENKYVFSEGDCTLVSEGEFYCVANGVDRHTDGDPQVYAQKDREGDKEIFYFDGVEVQRITNNSYDDFAPAFDDETLQIVWQGMVNDRLQIFIHDIPSNTTRQVTSGRQNSSNPNILGDIIVWQEWVDTNWEIMMTKIPNADQEFEVERITDNAVHDMFPVVYDGLLTWQSERGSSWEVVVYDIKTGKKQALEKDEDTKYENPRFVLLFDSKHDNGDVETIGYDLDTGEKMELGTKAHPEPIKPASPKDEVPDAIPQTASSTMNKVGKEDMDPSDDPVIE